MRGLKQKITEERGRLCLMLHARPIAEKGRCLQMLLALRLVRSSPADLDAQLSV
jgi:hypothetical protein